jgi:hypothetical protein
MPGHIAVKNPTPVMRNNEEAVEHADGERRDGEEIHYRNRFTAIAQKRSPSL